ncbi:TPA: hypothetical protein RHV32_004440 [Escherichia coli]|nr:hypothetical protein [Escherichia coli]EFT2988830.1 hypothetical protein [Escherichia coli]EHJ7899257.1 hypothetical protein [Escherichia coli]EJZ4188245.1 hypothetical protein [Escherichia coli]HDV1292421.1 hypothetical protein [Escherichia coli]
MKKTLIALAVAASAAVSGTSMAAVGEWTPGGEGGPFEMRGTLVVAGADANPWEVKVGPNVTNLDGKINQGDSEVKITVANAVPVLGIRTHSDQVFWGKPGISPQINYGGKIDLDSFSHGKTKLELDVTDASSSNKIGTMTTEFFTGAVYSLGDGTGNAYSSLFGMWASDAGDGFYGGLPKDRNEALKYSEVVSKFNEIDTSLLANFNEQHGSDHDLMSSTSFDSKGGKFSGAYGSGILTNEVLNIKLDKPAASQDIEWRASLPVTVTFA